MDPGFLFASAHFLQYSQFLRAQAARMKAEIDEKARLVLMEEHRRAMLASAREQSKTLIHELSVHPQRTYVKLQLIFYNLDFLGAVPDSFEDQKEKEDVQLVWQKLVNLVNKSRSNMTEAQLQECLACLNAISMKNLILAVSERLDKYLEYQRVKLIWEQLKARTLKIKKLQSINRWVCGIAALAFLLLFVNRVHQDPLAPLYLLWVFLCVLFGILFAWVLHSQNPRQYQAVEQVVSQLYEDASIGDETFWQLAMEKFDGIPTHEQLQARLAEQESVIRSLFGEENI